jgi:hypothetical protein
VVLLDRVDAAHAATFVLRERRSKEVFALFLPCTLFGSSEGDLNHIDDASPYSMVRF